MEWNREIVQKADMALSDLTAKGALLPKQMMRFLRIAIKKNVLSSQVRVITMNTNQEEHPKMLWTGRVMHAAQSGVALAYAQRSKPEFDKMVLTAVLGKAEVHMPREMLEDNIERNTLRSTLTSFLGEKVSADFEDRLIKGDTTNTTDDWLGQQSGLLKLATTNGLPSSGASLSEDILRDLIQTMPEEFDDGTAAFYTNRKARSDYRSSFRGQLTVTAAPSWTTTGHPDSLGADLVRGNLSPTIGYDDVPLYKVPRFPNDWGGANRTAVLYFNPKNMVMGFQRRVTLDTEFRISEQVWAIVVTVRKALNYEHEPAVAIATDVIG